MATNPEISTAAQTTLLRAAEAVMAKAYAPYSGFSVGAALLGADGKTYPGCNVENASYGLALCAERVALGHAVASGVRKFKAIAVTTSRGNVPIAPCGACRQVLAELAPDLEVVLPSPEGPRVMSLSDLLPDSFGPQDLEK